MQSYFPGDFAGRENCKVSIPVVPEESTEEAQRE
jgi:hypothetical protein